MISIEKCKELIKDSDRYSDKEIEEIRAKLYDLADLALETYFEEVKSGQYRENN